MGVVSMRDIKSGTTYLKAVVCPEDSYGITGTNTTTGIFKKYGRTVTPCTACPTNMKTSMYATPDLNAEHKITGYLTKTGTPALNTVTTPYTGASDTGGYVSVDACATQVNPQAAQNHAKLSWVFGTEHHACGSDCQHAASSHLACS
jgi:hypothetical protein